MRAATGGNEGHVVLGRAKATSPLSKEHAMMLKPVGQYRGAEYPTLATCLATKSRQGRPRGLALAAALALLAVLFSGCHGVS
jgi:hypothetical protein